MIYPITTSRNSQDVVTRMMCKITQNSGIWNIINISCITWWSLRLLIFLQELVWNFFKGKYIVSLYTFVRIFNHDISIFSLFSHYLQIKWYDAEPLVISHCFSSGIVSCLPSSCPNSTLEYCHFLYDAVLIWYLCSLYFRELYWKIVSSIGREGTYTWLHMNTGHDHKS